MNPVSAFKSNNCSLNEIPPTKKTNMWQVYQHPPNNCFLPCPKWQELSKKQLLGELVQAPCVFPHSLHPCLVHLAALRMFLGKTFWASPFSYLSLERTCCHIHTLWYFLYRVPAQAKRVDLRFVRPSPLAGAGSVSKAAWNTLATPRLQKTALHLHHLQFLPILRQQARPICPWAGGDLEAFRPSPRCTLVHNKLTVSPQLGPRPKLKLEPISPQPS